MQRHPPPCDRGPSQPRRQRLWAVPETVIGAKHREPPIIGFGLIKLDRADIGGNQVANLAVYLVQAPRGIEQAAAFLVQRKAVGKVVVEVR